MNYIWKDEQSFWIDGEILSSPGADFALCFGNAAGYISQASLRAPRIKPSAMPLNLAATYSEHCGH